MKIKMTSRWFEVTKITKKTKAMFFKELVVGDIIGFHCHLDHIGYGGSGLYATSVTVEMATHGSMTDSFSNISNRLRNFELKEL